MKIILGITGSVATILTPKLAQALVDSGHEVKIVATDHSLYFLPENTGEYLGIKKPPADIDVVKIYRDKDEWPVGGYHKQDPVQHIDFRTWADLLLIAPLSANTLAKIAQGLCDNFLCCIARAWKKDKPFVIAPAMNTEMWTDSITNDHLRLLYDGRYSNMRLVEPIEATLACGETGMGAMARIEKIVEDVNSFKK